MRLRSLLSVAATLTLIGVALAATGSQELGSVATLAGLVGLIVGLHRFGRSGPDEPADLAAERPEGGGASE
jgi:hypothetical protein